MDDKDYPPLNANDNPEYAKQEMVVRMVTPGLTNPNNCETCDYKAMDYGDGHCYMFKDAPTEVCMQHSARVNAIVDSMPNTAFPAAGTNRGTIDLQAGYAIARNAIMESEDELWYKQLLASIVEEEDLLWMENFNKTLSAIRKSMNKRKKQRRATTGRRR
jgi:hypothetical protein